MSDMKYAKDIDFNFLKMGFWSTIILGILKLANLIDVSIFVVFLPLIIAIGGLFFIIFFIGLITIYFVTQEMEKEENGEVNSDE